MKKLMSTIGVVAVLFATAVAQDASAPEKGPHGKHGKYQALMNEIPDLTDEQRAQIKEIHQAARENAKGQREESKQIRMKLMELKTADDPNQAEINRLIDRQAEIKANMMKERTAAELKVRSILTPEQRKVVDAKMKERAQDREKRHQERKMQQSK